MRKVAGEENQADLFTRHRYSSKKLDQLLKLSNCYIASGRAESTAKCPDNQAGVSLVAQGSSTR